MRKRYYELTKEERWEIEKDVLFKNRNRKTFNALSYNEYELDDEEEMNTYDYVMCKIDHTG